MEDSTNSMVIPNDPSKSIIKLFFQIEKVLQIADEANNPFKNSQIVAKSCLLI